MKNSGKIKNIFLQIIAMGLFTGVPRFATAFPEMIRHHYVNCTACHFSPSGGGVLTPYGRTISFDVLSTWGNEKEARPFYGALDNEKLNQWLQVGGNVRALQMHHESSSVREGRLIPMQEGIEVAVYQPKWSAVAFIGKTNQDWTYRAISPRYFVNYQIQDELSFRIGRFIPVFGLNVPQHTLPTRASLGFGQGAERDNAEMMWSGEKLNVAYTLSKSLAIASGGDPEFSQALQVNYTLKDSYRIGASYWYGDSSKQSRKIIGLHAALGFSPSLYLLTETDYLMRNPKEGAASSKGVFHFAKLGYEIFKGFHLQAVEEQSKSDLEKDLSIMDSYGVGFLFYPRPHFEFEALYSKKRILAVSDQAEDYAYLMGHYYF